VIGLFGSVFDPPHNGHVALLREARARLGFGDAVVFVVARPGHKHVKTDAETRLALAHAAFPDEHVELDPNPRTIDTLRDRRFDDPIFLIGADEFLDFPGWKEPDAVLDLARIGVATRPGYPRECFDDILARLGRPDRVLFFDLEPVDVSSSEVRERVSRGEPIDGLVPAAVAAEIAQLGLYRTAR
jgi:nicotinate-nucleotide adenylyltransferase